MSTPCFFIGQWDSEGSKRNFCNLIPAHHYSYTEWRFLTGMELPTALGFTNVPLTGVQGGGHVHDGPQPLGIFCKARTYPNQHSGAHVIHGKVLEISKLGVLFGLVGEEDYWDDRIDWGYAGHGDLDEAASQADSLEGDDLALSDDSYMEDVWARALRLTRCAV